MEHMKKVDGLMQEFKQGRFIYGEGCMKDVGAAVAGLGSKALLIRSDFPGIDLFQPPVTRSVLILYQTN